MIGLQQIEKCIGVTSANFQKNKEKIPLLMNKHFEIKLFVRTSDDCRRHGFLCAV